MNDKNVMKLLRIYCRRLARKRSDLKTSAKKIGKKRNFGFSESWFNESNDQFLSTLDSTKYVVFDAIDLGKRAKNQKLVGLCSYSQITEPKTGTTLFLKNRYHVN